MKKYENFCDALKNMEEMFAYTEPYDNVTLTGLVGVFEICFEQSRKTMKEILLDHGYDESRTGSPKQILKTAYASGMIDDEELWLKALVARNNVTHAYDKSVALDIIRQAKESYYGMFCKLKETIDNNWLC